MSLLAAALDVSEYWLMGFDMPMEREGSGEAAGSAEDGNLMCDF